MKLVDRLIALALVAVHAFLLAWATIGFVEMGWPAPPWPRVSNPLFSDAMLFLQWSVVAGAALTYLIGYFARWPALPTAMVAWYVVMAMICAWQTFFILEHAGRFIAMATEYAAYLAISVYLHISVEIRERPRTVPV